MLKSFVNNNILVSRKSVLSYDLLYFTVEFVRRIGIMQSVSVQELCHS